MKRAIFLDRDGVLNATVICDGRSHPPSSVAEIKILDGVAEACTLLKSLGFYLIIVTNQPDVGRGTQNRETVEAIHRKICNDLPIDRVEVCYDSGDGIPSKFRKPEPGMLLAAATELSLDIRNSYMIGDRWRDIDAGKAAGCKTILIENHYTGEPFRALPNWRVPNLLEAAHMIACTEKDRESKQISNLRVKLFADCADISDIVSMEPLVHGFTTNPSLMNQAGIRDYEAFAKTVLSAVPNKPVSFEVFSDDFSEMRRQALKIHHWQENVYVKVPVTNSRGESTIPLIRELSKENLKLNITALLTRSQMRSVASALNPEVPSIVSVFCGRIADTGRDPMPMMRESLHILRARQPGAKLLWASVREPLNIYQAEECGCDIITVQRGILEKALKFCGMDLMALSIATVRTFKADSEKGCLIL